MKERLKTFLFLGPRGIVCRWQQWPARDSLHCSLGHFATWPLTSVGGGGWVTSRHGQLGSCHRGHPLRCPPHPPPVPDPNLQTPRRALALEDGVYLPCSSPAGRALPIAEKATIQQKGFVRPGPQGKPARSFGFSPFVSRLKT